MTIFQKHVKIDVRRLKQLALLMMSLLISSAYGYADTDSRMIVEVAANEQGQVPAVQEAIEQALPVLWDRVVEDSARMSLSDKIKGTPFLLRVVPHAGGVQVTFNSQRVWQYLDEHEIAYLKEAPRLNLQIQMINQDDNRMPKTAGAILSYGEEIALARGMVLDQHAPALVANWRWLDASQIYLSVQGSSILAGYSETRSVETGDPLAQLQAWVKELLLKVRDTKSTDVVGVVAGAAVQKHDDGIEFVLTIEQASSLSEQVVLEDSLRQNSRVKAMIPVYLSRTSRQYRMLLQGEDDAWITAWFQRRGMQIIPTPYGWLVQ